MNQVEKAKKHLIKLGAFLFSVPSMGNNSRVKVPSTPLQLEVLA